jgi:hypothetical protein
MYLYVSSSNRSPTCITKTRVKAAVMTIKTISVTAIPIILRLIDNLIMVVLPPQTPGTSLSETIAARHRRRQIVEMPHRPH